MHKKTLVSVITIFLNAEKFIQEAIASVIAQSYDHWELLLVDDGSTDASTAIAKAYAEQYPNRIFYLEHEGHQNRGMSATRNLGIRHAKGDYVAILDSDDVWEAHKLAVQVEILDAHPHVAMVYGPTRFWFSWSHDSQNTDFLSGTGVKPNTVIYPPAMLTRFFKSCPYPCSVLFRRDTALKLQGFEEKFRGMYEDQVFFAKIFAKEAVFISDQCLDKYRQHPDSCCSIAIELEQFHPDNPNPATYKFLLWLKNYYIQQEIKNLKVWIVLQNMLLPYHYPTLYKLLHPFNKQLDNLKRYLGQVKEQLILKKSDLLTEKS